MASKLPFNNNNKSKQGGVSKDTPGIGRKKNYFSMDTSSVQYPDKLNKSDIEIGKFKDTKTQKTIPLKGLKTPDEAGTLSSFKAQEQTRSYKKAKRADRNSRKVI